jgi:hypothetical protein
MPRQGKVDTVPGDVRGYGVGAHLTEEAMIAYAHERAYHGRKLLEKHISDPTGSCRECGRTHPCPERRYGGDLLVHFDHWVSSPNSPSRPDVVDSTPDYPG